jgi:glucosyl-3-phosphoglycerate synthase
VGVSCHGYHRPVADWFARRTFHHSRFQDLHALLRAKEAGGHTVSVCIPTVNEEATIGPIVRRIRESLMEAVPLVDELAIMDSSSSDDTVRIARECGADVYQERDVLPGLEPLSGKGEALWKSLFVVKGDLIAWCDGDIENFEPSFVAGVLGPLLTDPEIGFVKAFYERPMRSGPDLVPGEGGRVTELTARPLLNTFWPHLAPLVQPLSGEYAGRRALLDQVPFFSGYGVEIGLVIDIAERFGLEAFAQVDLGDQVHRNRGVQELARMAFAILQVILRRLESTGRLDLRTELGRTLYQFVRRDGELAMQGHEIEVGERPPMAGLPEYRSSR